MDVELLKPGDRVKYKLADYYHPATLERWRRGTFVRRVKRSYESQGNMVVVLFDGHKAPTQCTANILTWETPDE